MLVKLIAQNVGIVQWQIKKRQQTSYGGFTQNVNWTVLGPFSNFREIFIKILSICNVHELDWLKNLLRDPAFIVDIVRHMDWLKLYFEMKFALQEKDGVTRFDSYNQEGL